MAARVPGVTSRSAKRTLPRSAQRRTTYSRTSGGTAITPVSPPWLPLGGLKSEGFALGGALDHVAEHWVDQVQSLRDACAHISNHLRFTKNQHTADESYVAGTLSSISQLDEGFDHRTGH